MPKSRLVPIPRKMFLRRPRGPPGRRDRRLPGSRSTGRRESRRRSRTPASPSGLPPTASAGSGGTTVSPRNLRRAGGRIDHPCPSCFATSAARSSDRFSIPSPTWTGRRRSPRSRRGGLPRVREELRDLPVRVLDERLLDEAEIAEILLELPVGDLVQDLVGFPEALACSR